jgi:hypothetical protein
MGWGRYFFLGDLGQQLDLSDQKNEIENLKRELYRSRNEPENSAAGKKQLEDKIDELRLYLAAVVRLLIAKKIVTPEEMAQLIDVIDAEDGVRDGKYKGKVD